MEKKKKNRVLEKDSRVEEKLVGLDFYGQYRETDGMVTLEGIVMKIEIHVASCHLSLILILLISTNPQLLEVFCFI